MDESATVRAVLGTAAQLDVLLPPGALKGLATFCSLFLAWNEKINLGGDITGELLTGQHFADAFAASTFVPPNASVIDVGSGGGLPVLPLALLCDTARFQLWEPTSKKVSFLRTAVRELGLQPRVEVRAGRVEPGRTWSGEKFDVAMSRATFAPADWLPLGRTLVAPSGRVLVFGTTHLQLAELPGGSATLLRSVTYGSNRRLLCFSGSG